MLPTEQQEALELDRIAIDLLRADVVRVQDSELSRRTPCEGWAIADLLDHMNHEHAVICGGAVDPDADPRAEFASMADRWLDFFSSAGDGVKVANMGTYIPTSMVLAAHFADMIVHRWDLAASLRRPCPIDPELVDRAHAVAELVTAKDSPLVGSDGVYKPALQPDPTASPLENLVRRYGRDHRGPMS